MKILHIGDMAGSAAITSNICTKLGYESHVVQDLNIDTFRHGEFYQNTTYVNGDEDIINFVEHNSEYYDHLVYHDRYSLAVDLNRLCIPSSYMFHGNMLRQQPELYDMVLELETIDNVFVTTEDLLEYADEADMFWRPVDMDLFRPLSLQKKDVALCLTQERYKQYIRELAYMSNKGIFIMDRVKNVTPYHKMPELLNSFSGYVDLKFQPKHPPHIIQEMSQTGLQALACGIPVLNYAGNWIKTMPKRHIDEISAQEFISVIKE